MGQSQFRCKVYICHRVHFFQSSLNILVRIACRVLVTSSTGSRSSPEGSLKVPLSGSTSRNACAHVILDIFGAVFPGRILYGWSLSASRVRNSLLLSWLQHRSCVCKLGYRADHKLVAGQNTAETESEAIWSYQISYGPSQESAVMLLGSKSDLWEMIAWKPADNAKFEFPITGCSSLRWDFHSVIQARCRHSGRFESVLLLTVQLADWNDSCI